MARSTLELLLDSIKDREEEPPDRLPALPQRPTSRARLPSRKRTSALLLNEPSFEQPYDYSRGQNFPAFDASKHHNNGPRHPNAPTVLNNVEQISTASRNGYKNDANNGDQSIQDHSPVETVSFEGGKEDTVSATETQSRFSYEGDFVEQALPSEKQANTSAYFNLRKRRRVYHLRNLQKDARVWLLNKETMWVLGNIQSLDGDSERVVCTADGQLLEVPSETLLPANPAFLDEVDDLAQLSFIHEPAVFHVLQQRHELGMHYTRAGVSLLLYLPSEEKLVQTVSHSFKQSPLDLYLMGRGYDQPHVCQIVDNAYNFLKGDWKNQSIIIGGECLAGKMKSAKEVLTHLVSRGKNDELGKTFLMSNLVLEVFGNAVVDHSASASRLGKLVDVNFDKEGILCGAQVGIVFWEKSRVVRGSDYSYHVFYQLYEGADNSLREKLNLRAGLQFNYLKVNESVSGAHPYVDFQSLLNALDLLGFTRENQQAMFSLLGAILWLGNITSAGVDHNEAVDNAACLLKCPKKDLIEALGGGGPKPQDVSAARDALACAIYEWLLDWLLAQINKVLKPKTASESKCITIVDVPTFGSIKSDGLDGLLVNYAQDHLHCFTRFHLLQQEEEVTSHRKESFTADSANNEESISFLEHELLPLLGNHEICNSLDLSELSFKHRMEKLSAGKSICKQTSTDTLTVAHSFGEATYNIGSLLKDTKALLKPPTCLMWHSCITKSLEMPENNSSGPSGNGFFEECLLHDPLFSAQERVLEMMVHLEDTDPHFIFCLAQSEKQTTKTLDQGYVIRQLRVINVCEAMKVGRSGNCLSISHELFASRYAPLLGPDTKTLKGPLDTSVAVLHRLKVPPHFYRMGWTRVWVCLELLDKLDHARKGLATKIIDIQKTFRGHRVRKQLEEQRKAVTHLQAFVRGWLVRKGFSAQFGRRNSLDGEDSFVNQEASALSRGDPVQNQLNSPLSNRRVSNRDQKIPLINLSGMQQMQPVDVELALQKKDEEITILEQNIKEYERKYVAYEAKVKLMEETWQKQVSFLEQRLSAATKGSNTEESAYKAGDSDKGVLISTPPHGASTRDTPGTTIGDPEVALPKSENDPSKSAVDNLSKEFEHRAQIFNDDAKFLVEVKSGQIAASFKPDEELQKLRQRFEAWKKDYKGKLKETKGILKKLGKGDAMEKNKKRWWSKK